MILPNITEMDLVGIFDRGVANKERITLRPKMQIDLGCYGIMLGVKTPNGLATPIQNELFWFGDGTVQPPQWLFIYTGEGKSFIGTTEVSNEPAIALFWNKPNVIFTNFSIVPILFRVSDVLLGE